MIYLILMNQVNFKFMNANYNINRILLLLIIQFGLSANNHPIFLIHGFMGWGREELNNYYYWGGEKDLETELRNKGFDVYTLSVGPISSNWDRAIEAYTQIKGGCVDYGLEHSKKYGITQKPSQKCYEGLYPEWDKNHPIHIIGHSQGGLTARMLEYLLATIIENESSELLSKTYENYIKSITTLSTPHNGTSLSLIVNNNFPSLQKLSIYAGIINNMLFQNYYNFDLDQWGLAKNETETYYQFIQRINNSNIKLTKNSASWDVSTEGVKYFNELYESNDNIYYFSYSTSSTIQKINSQYHKPNHTMSYYLRPTAILMGNKQNISNFGWYENDGIVNTISMDGPHDEIIIQYSGSPIKGIWQNMGILYYDHHQILFRRMLNNDREELMNLYVKHCHLLYSL